MTPLTKQSASNDSLIADSAKSIAEAVSSLAKSHSRVADLFEKLLKARTHEQVDDVTVAFANEGATMAETLRRILQSIPAVPHALVDKTRPAAKGDMSNLVITADQRAELIRELRAIVGPKPDDKTMDKDRSYTAMAAVILWRWLHRPGYKVAPDR